MKQRAKRQPQHAADGHGERQRQVNVLPRVGDDPERQEGDALGAGDGVVGRRPVLGLAAARVQVAEYIHVRLSHHHRKPTAPRGWGYVVDNDVKSTLIG